MTDIALEDVVHVYRDRGPGNDRSAGGVRAVDGVSLRIGAGERVALIGQNGSGKTTLVRHLDGLLRPTSGRVMIDGVDAASRTVAQLARIVGLVFQDPDRQIFAPSVRAEVEFGPRNIGLHDAALRAAVGEALAATGLTGSESVNPYDLGGSRRKLLAIASVLAMRTPVLVLDEPTTGQDVRGVALVRSVIDAAHAAGRTVVAITHDMGFAAEAFDRIVGMREGRVVLDGAPTAAFAADAWATLRSTYVEPPLAAVIGERLRLGSTPTDAALLGRLAAGQ